MKPVLYSIVIVWSILFGLAMALEAPKPTEQIQALKAAK